MTEYEALCWDTTNWQTECRKNASTKLYELLKIKKETADKTYQKYLSDKEKRSQYEKEMFATQLETRKPVEYTKQQVMEAVKVLEDLKMEVREKMYAMAKEQNGNSNQMYISGKVKAEELKKSDKLFEQTGIEEVDLEASIDRLDLRNDVDYKEIMQMSQLKQMQFT